MRLVTYLGLVARRVWAKRGILVGSFLGATLVTALLVIVPLYEASVQAVDLVFTVKGAPSDQVDLVLFQNTNSYNGNEATRNRQIVEEQRTAEIAEWYPTTLERTQSREFLVIPIDGAVDWVGLAEQWQEALTEALAAEVPEEELPSPPYPTPPPEATQVRIFTSPTLEDFVNVVEGDLPPPLLGAPASDEAAPLPIAIGADVAAGIGREVGDSFVIRPFSGLPQYFEIVEVAAVVEAVDPDSKIWGLDSAGSMFFLPEPTFNAWTRPITVDPEGDPWLRSTRGFPDTTATQRLFVEFDPLALDLEELGALKSGLQNFENAIAQLTQLAPNTFLDSLLAAFDTRSVIVGAPILAMLALVVGGALYFLVYTAALTLEREGPELALLRTRGASGWQTVGIHLGQSLFIAVVAAALAPTIARFLVGVTGRVPPLSDLTGGQALEVAQIRSIVPFVLAGAAVTFVSMGLAIFPFARRRVLELRSLAARPTSSSIWQRYNLDLFAIALSLVILWQLTQRGFINFTEGEAKLDALAVVFPVLLLFTGALVLLRLLPWLLRALGWLMTKSRRMAFALPGWHLGRNPVPYGRLALLVWLTTGFGAFALTYANTLDASFVDRAEFAAGADVRIVDEGAGWLDAPDGTEAAAVLRTEGAPRLSQRQAEVLAVRPDDFSSVVKWRDDFGSAAPADVFSALRPDGAAPDLGVEVPGDAVALTVEGVVVPPSLAEQARLTREPNTDLRLMVKVFDARGQVWTMQADRDFVDDRWTAVTVDLTDGLNTGYPNDPVPPLTIHTMWVERSAPSGGTVLDGDVLLVDGLRFVHDDETTTPADASELDAINGMGFRASIDGNTARDALYDEMPEGETAPTGAALEASPLTRNAQVQAWLTPPNRNRLNPVVPQLRKPAPPMRVILDSEAAGIAGLGLGEDAFFSVAGQVFEGEMVAFVEQVPAMLDRRKQGRMVLDLDALSAYLNGPATWSFNSNLARIDGPGELWIATDDTDAAIRRINAQFPANQEPDEVFSVRASESDFSSRPVQVGLVSILFVGAATSVALALAGVTGYVLLAVSRRAREMGVLRALGLQRRDVAATFAIEQIAVLGVGAVVGIFGGIGLMRAMVPFLQLGETAEEIVPAVRLDVEWSVLLSYIALVGVLLIISVVWATRRVSARRMSEVLREVER